MKDSKAVEVNRRHSIVTFRWLGLITVLAFRASMAGQELRIQSFHQLTTSQGWALINNHLLATDSAGTRWTEITPPAVQGNIDGVFFQDRAMGWAVISRPGESPRLVATTDGGASWTITGLAVTNGAIDFINYGGIATISFADATHGWILLRSVSSINFSRGILLRTINGGETWSRLSNPPIADGLDFLNHQLGWLTGGPDGNQSFVTQDGGTTWTATPVAPPAKGAVPLAKQSQISEAARANLEGQARLIAPDAVIARAQLNPAGDGWMEAVTGQCTGFKTGCSETSHLLAVNAGVVTEITPRTTQAPQRPSAAATVVISTKLGFDQCSAGTVSQMSAWFAQSPYRDANIYIGGVLRGCSQPTLNASWVTSIFDQGWHIIPTWVGPQAPCAGFASSISTNTTTAFNEGVSEATSAVSAADALGLSSSIVYYDMEHYDETNSSCQAAVDSFISGWSHMMRSSGFGAGVYGSPFDMAAGWATVANVPDDVWIAAWNGSTSTVGIAPLPDTLWAHSQRLHQFQGGHNETWGGVTFNIDNDSENGQVAAPVTAAPNPDYSLSVPNGSATVQPGASATYTVNLTPTNGFTGSVNFACTSGVPTLAACSFNPGAVTLNGGGQGSTTLTISTTAPTAALPASGLGARLATGGGLFGLVLVFGLATKETRRRTLFLMLSVLSLTMVLISCGGRSSTPGGSSTPHNPGTPAGTFMVTISATSGSTTHTSTITLMVQ